LFAEECFGRGIRFETGGNSDGAQAKATPGAAAPAKGSEEELRR
jgi:hypothetical protein